VIVCRDDLVVAHDGSEEALTRTFPPELVDRVVEVTDTREVCLSSSVFFGQGPYWSYATSWLFNQVS